MNKLKRKTTLLQRITALIAALLLISSSAKAAEDYPYVTIYGVEYSIDVSADSAWVSGHTTELTTTVDIWKEVSYEGKTYPVESIGESAFHLCYNIESVVIPEGVTYIDDYAFGFCTKMSSLTIPEGVTAICKSAFAGCASLESVSIPESVVYIDEFAFAVCTGVKSFTIPKNVKYIAEDAFYYDLNVNNNSSYTQGQPWGAFSLNGEFDIEIDANTSDVILTHYYGKGGEVIIYPGITTIGDCAFVANDNITSVYLPDGVKKIGTSAFLCCRHLKSVTIPSTVESIDKYAFYEVKNVINNSSYTTDKPWGALTLNGEVDGDFVFEPNTNTTILSAYIGNGGSVEIPKSVKIIDNKAFSYCTNLSPIDIPEGVKTIRSSAFEYCKMVTIPKSVTEIQQNAFGYVKNIINNSDLTDDEIWGALTLNGDIDDGFVYKANTDKKILTGYIGNGGDVVIPNGVTSIGKDAFSFSDITSLTIPESVTTIGHAAFSQCFDITDVYCSVNPSVLNSGVEELPGFEQDLLQITYHVLNEYLETWKDKFAGNTNVTFIGDIKSIADVSIPSQKYTGKALTPVVKDGDKTLILGKDYTISPADGEYINAGDYKVTITGMQLYYKSVEKTFTITSQQSTPVANIADSPRVKVWSFNSTIFIESATDAKYSIYDLNGRVITTSTTKSTKEEIRTHKPGIYVVVVNGESYKVAVQ